MVLLHVRVVANPLVADGHALFAALEHPAHEHLAHLRVPLFAAALVHCLLENLDAFVHAGEDAAGAAEDGAGQLVAVLGYIVSCDEGAHAVAEHEVGKIRILLSYNRGQGVLVLHHGVGAFVAPVAPDIVLQSGLAVTHMVIGRYDEAKVHEMYDHAEISA